MISIGGILILLLLILLCIIIISKLRQHGSLKIRDILWKNYKQGKISKEEYEEFKKDFNNKSKNNKESTEN